MTPISQAFLYILFAVLAGGELLSAYQNKYPQRTKTKIVLKRIAIGITGGLLALYHGAMLPVTMGVFFVLFLLAVIHKNAQSVKTAMISALLALLLIAPWTYRNWIAFERFMPVAGGSGLVYFNGIVHWNCIIDQPQQEGESFVDASLRVSGLGGTEEDHTYWRGLKDIEMENKISQKMVEDMKQNTGLFIKKMALNSIEYYFPILTYPFLAAKKFNLDHLGLTIFHLTLWILAAIGIIKRRKANEGRMPEVLLICAIFLFAIWYLPFATFIGHSIYTFSTIPMLSILAAAAFQKTCPAN